MSSWLSDAMPACLGCGHTGSAYATRLREGGADPAQI